MSTFQNNVLVLVGASRGIGEQMAYLLGAQGARLVLTARSVVELDRAFNLTAHATLG